MFNKKKSSNLYKFEDGKGRGAVFTEQETHNADELSVKATVTQAQQETAYQSHKHATKTHNQLKQMNTEKRANKHLDICLRVWYLCHTSSLFNSLSYENYSTVTGAQYCTWAACKLASVCLPLGLQEHRWLC